MQVRLNRSLPSVLSSHGKKPKKRNQSDMTNPPRKILVLGNGWIGTEIAKFFSAQTSDMHLETGSELPESLWKGVNVVINAIAKTNIDWCENHKQEALQSNAIVATELAKQCQKRNITYVFISSACIFESKNTRDIKYEDSEPKPRCFYSETKVLAEKLIQEAYPQTLIVRIRLPLSETPHPRNTVTKIRSNTHLKFVQRKNSTKHFAKQTELGASPSSPAQRRPLCFLILKRDSLKLQKSISRWLNLASDPIQSCHL